MEYAKIKMANENLLIKIDKLLIWSSDFGPSETFTHTPDVDHMNEITSLTCSDTLGLFASAGQDSGLRLWNVDNELVRYVNHHST